MKYSVILMLLLLSMPLILGDTIGDTTIIIKIYNNTIEVINNEYPGNNQIKTFEILNNTNTSVISNHLVKYKEFSFSLIFIQNKSVGIDVVSQYVVCLGDKTTCLEEKASYNTAWTRCLLDLEEYEGENSTSYKEELSDCTLINQQKDIEIQGQQKTIGNLEEEEKSTKNAPYIWGAICGIIGIIGALVYCGKIGKGMVKDKSEDEFNKRQSG